MPSCYVGHSQKRTNPREGIETHPGYLHCGLAFFRQKRTNPREGIETSQLGFGDNEAVKGQKRTNPREGIETFFPMLLFPPGYTMVRKERIPVRGLKL